MKQTCPNSSELNLKPIVKHNQNEQQLDCSKVRLHGLVGPLNVISLYMDLNY